MTNIGLFEHCVFDIFKILFENKSKEKKKELTQKLEILKTKGNLTKMRFL